MNTKVCTKCGEEKALTDFHKDSQKKDGLASQCRSCHAKRNREKYLENIEESREYSRKQSMKFRKDNPDNWKKYYNSNKKEILEGQKKYNKSFDLKEGYAVYYLPEHHYIGMTKNIRSRMLQHRSKGRITEGYEIVGTYKCPVEAHITETIFHKMGYQGFKY